MSLRQGYTDVANVGIHGENTEGEIEMLSAEIKTENLKTIVNVISTLIDEVKFTISREGMVLKAVDPAHVAMIEMDIGSGAFDKYSYDSEEDFFDIGMDLEKIKAIIKLASLGDAIKLSMDPKTGKAVFSIGTITRSMNLVDASGIMTPKVPNLNLSSNVTVMAEYLQKGVRAAESISDHIAIDLNGNEFRLSCSGDTDDARLELSGDEILSIEVAGPIRSLFPLDYFSNLIKAVPASTEVTLELETNNPVRLRFTLADGNVSVAYFLAPRIE